MNTETVVNIVWWTLSLISRFWLVFSNIDAERITQYGTHMLLSWFFRTSFSQVRKYHLRIFHSTRKGDLMEMSHIDKNIGPGDVMHFTQILRMHLSLFRVVTRRLGPGRKVIWVILREGGGKGPKRKNSSETLMVQKFGDRHLGCIKCLGRWN